MSSEAPDPAVFARFAGDRGKALIVETLKDQKAIRGDLAAAEDLAARGQLHLYRRGEVMIAADDWSNAIFFILAGRVEISISGFKVAERRAGQHIGEMELIDPSQPRSASALVMEPTVALEVSEEDFVVVGSRHPDMWRQIARELADRLRERNKFIRPTNATPRMFVACAAESLPVAKAIQRHFQDSDLVVEIWADGVFKPSRGTMESLEAKLGSADFSVAIFSADDKVQSRGQEKVAPRDNTVFELGLFAGAIGRDRSFFAVPKGIDLKIPSDLAGITSLRYGLPAGEGAEPEIAEACAQIEERVMALGPR